MILCDRYRLEQVLGRGASAVVYRGTDLILGQPVAIKLLLTDGINYSPGAQEHGIDLRIEAIAAMRLSHPHILRVYNYERDDNNQYLIMEFVPGKDTRRVCAQLPGKHLPVSDTIRVGLECLDALAHAHELGVLHHDIKPSNIMLTRAGSAKVCDFGIARLMGTRTPTPSKQLTIGTPAYISPERVAGREYDARSDLYSLAATLYRLGNGHSVFQGDTPSIFAGHLYSEVPPSQILPPVVHEVLVNALAKDPENRYTDAREMHRALLRAKRRSIAGRPAAPAKQPGDYYESIVASPSPRRPRQTDHPMAVGTAPNDQVAQVAPAAHAPQVPRVTPRVPPSDPAASSAPRFLPGSITDERDEAVDATTSIHTPSVATPDVRDTVEERRGDPIAVVPDDMVLVKSFELVSAYGGSIHVRDFLIDRTPVSNRAFLEFVRATGALPPTEWGGMEPPQSLLDHPVVGISYQTACHYASWAGKRLPSGDEWETAARRPDGRTFPWGDEWRAGRCNTRGEGPGATTPVASYPDGATVDGCHDLLGNVWEWTSSSLDSVDDIQEGYALVYGGSFKHRAVAKGAIARSSVMALSCYSYLGFRCARDL